MRTCIGVLAVALLAVSCGSGDEQTAADEPGTTAPSPSSSTSEAPATTSPTGETVTTVPPDPSNVEARRFEIDGAVVWTRTALDELPQQATVARFTSTLIDSGDGLELCAGGVKESLPPQCSGLVVDGLDPAGWTETDGGVTWGTRTVTVAWPPVDGHLTLVADEEPVERLPLGDEGREGLPEQCESIETYVDSATMLAFAEANKDRVDIPRSVDGGTDVLALAVVEEHLEDVRAELTGGGAEPCLEPVTYSAAELEAAQDALLESGLYYPDGPVAWSASGNALNRLDLSLTVADRATLDAVLSVTDDPGIFHITGVGEILEGG